MQLNMQNNNGNKNIVDAMYETDFPAFLRLFS